VIFRVCLCEGIFICHIRFDVLKGGNVFACDDDKDIKNVLKFFQMKKILEV